MAKERPSRALNDWQTSAVSYKGYKHSPETKAKMSERKTGKKATGETKIKMSLAHKGKKLSPKASSNIKQGIAEKRYTEDYAKKLSDTKLGEINPQAVLTEADVIKIRELYQPYKFSQQKLADQFGVHRSTIQDIIENRTWKHI